MISQTSCSHTSQQNGVAERKYRHILDVARTLMIHMSVVLSACYLINRMLFSFLNKRSLFSCLYANKNPFSVTPCVFGCTCFVQDLSLGLDKLSPRSLKCVFVGYSRTQKEYKCYNSSTRKYLVSADVTFFESVLYFSTQAPLTASEIAPPSLSASLPTPAFTVSLPAPPAETIDPPASKGVWDFKYVYTHRLKVSAFESVLANPSSVDGPLSSPSASPSDLDISIALRKGKRSCTDHPISNFISYNHLNPTFHQFALSLPSESIPRSYTEVSLVPA